MKQLSAHKFIIIVILILSIFGPITHAQTNDVTETTNPPDFEIITVNNPKSFIVELDFEQSFYITANTADPGPYPGCSHVPVRAFPKSTSSYGLTWAVTGTFQMDYWINPSPPINYKFVARSDSFSIFTSGPGFVSQANLATGTAPSGNVFMAIDHASGYLFLADGTQVFSYKLSDFHNAISTTPPGSSPTAPTAVTDATSSNPMSHSNLQTVKIYNNKMYFVTTSYVEAYPLDSSGLISGMSDIWDTNNLNNPTDGITLDLKDIAFLGSYVFILDHNEGVYVLDGTGFVDLDLNLKIKKKNGIFLEVSPSCVIVLTKTTNVMYEYFIVGDTPITELRFNRHILSGYGNKNILQSDIDDNYLYLAVENSYPLVIRHSIPARFQYVDFQYLEQTPYFGFGTSIKVVASSSTRIGTATFISLDGASVSEWDITVTKPFLMCTANYMPGCQFTLNIVGVQRTCAARTTTTDPNDICLLKQDMDIIVLNSHIPCHIPGKDAPTGLALSSNVIFQDLPNTASNNIKNMKSRISEKIEKTNDGSSIEPETPNKSQNLTRNNDRRNRTIEKANTRKTVDISKDPNIFQTQEKTKDQSLIINPANRNQLKDYNRGKETKAQSVSPQNFMQHVDSSYKSESSFTVTDSSQTQDEVVIEMMNENNRLMNGLILGLMMMFVILLIFVLFVFWYFNKAKTNSLEEDDVSFEEEESDLNIQPDDYQKKRSDQKEKHYSTQILTTFGDESKVDIANEISQIEVN